MAGSISGCVVDAAGTPLSGVAVYIAQSDQPHHDIAAISSADGTFRLHGLRPGTYLIAADGGELAGTVSVQLSSERASTVEILLA